MTVAAVFDSAGTLLRTYRSVLSVADHQMTDANSETTTLTFQDPDRVLILLNLHPSNIMNKNPDILLSTYLTEADVHFEISCGRGVIIPNAIEDILYKDKIATISDMQKVIRDCWVVISKKNDKFTLNTGAIINMRTKKIEFTIAAVGHLFPGVREMITILHKLNVAVFIASGDRTEKLIQIANQVGIPKNHVNGMATPVIKAQIIQKLKNEYDTVVMTGDGINDLFAMKAADISILTIQQEGIRPETLFKTADYIIENICQTTQIIQEKVINSKIS